MTTVLAKMYARLHDDRADHGTRCRWCRETALACQIEFLETGEDQHCCRRCKTLGAAQAHVAQ